MQVNSMMDGDIFKKQCENLPR
eukprot:SAG11_NODE_7764_length_1099_cov_2.059000_1_plen_21_part_10